MESNNEHFRHILLFYFRKGKNAAQAAKRDVHGEEALKERQCRNWFDKFRSGDFSLKYEQRSGRPLQADNDQIKAIIVLDRHISQRDIGEKLKIPKSTIHDQIKHLGFVKKLDIWVPHELKEINLTKRINACDSHLKRNEFDPFLKRIITGDEKWIVYDNIKRKHSWSKRDEPPQTTSKLIFRKRRFCYQFGGIGRNYLDGKTLKDDETVKSHLDQFFADKNQKFYELGIMKLPEIWQKVIEQNGKY
ncbi:PREDICTED: histone-lysine N-methyltransferase SETMAR-like, partial [Dinoponera quadriceps]|uniref:Histone-lysine N-methyltransferase SETMAR-like n=1 Tax=Dinoponera quadriceps TaxID=609295 RepID=A0A6P3Y7A1_DINQU